jgi:hypothetical protein
MRSWTWPLGRAPRWEARAEALRGLVALRQSLRGSVRAGTATPGVRLAERDLSEFLDHPEARKARPASPSAPPGRPIGGS